LFNRSTHAAAVAECIVLRAKVNVWLKKYFLFPILWGVFPLTHGISSQCCEKHVLFSNEEPLIALLCYNLTVLRNWTACSQTFEFFGALEQWVE